MTGIIADDKKHTDDILGPPITECRGCGTSDLIPILSLGNQYPSNFIDEDFSPNEKDKIPLELVFCGKKECGLLQLKHTASRKFFHRFTSSSTIIFTNFLKVVLGFHLSCFAAFLASPRR